MNKKHLYQHYFVYETYNHITKKSYIGWHATDNLNDSYLGSGKHLKRSIKKYGQGNFTRSILEYCNENNVLEKEIYWISKKNTLSPIGYNLTLGGEGSLGRECTPETREKLRNASTGTIASEKTREKLRLSHIGKKYKNYKSHPISEETKDKISNANKGRKHTPEARSNMNKAKKGVPLSKEHREKLSKSLNGKPHKLKLVICPHCGKSGKGGNMPRYHFDNCKLILK